MVASRLIGCISLMSLSATLYAQEETIMWNDSLKISVGVQGMAASKGFQPFWMTANKYGAFTDRKNDVAPNLFIYNEHILNAKDSTSSKERWKLSYTFDLYNNNHFKDFVLVEANAKLNYKGWQLRMGRYREIIGEVDSSLSTGSLGLSGNALPIPKISIAVLEYKDVPFTNGWLQYKGLLSHGWLGNNRYFNSLLHEKAFYMRIGKGKVKVFGGAVHFGEWGGQRDGYELDRSFRGFLDVLFVNEANDGSLPSTSGKRPNRAGDQRGILEYGVDWESKYGNWHFYNQMFFESGTGIDIRNIDRLAGLSLKFKKPSSTIKKVLLEFIYTKQMESYGKELQSYYNNGFYKTGWEYEDRVIGTPLFINRVRGSNFLPLTPFDWHIDETKQGRIRGNANIVSNRIIGFNVGAEYKIKQSLFFRSKFTYNVHFMDRAPIANLPKNSYKQFYSMQELNYTLNAKFSLQGGIAYDWGDFYNNFGGTIGIRYQVK